MILNEFSDSSFYIESSGGGDSSIAAAEVNSSTIFTELGIDSSPGMCAARDVDSDPLGLTIDCIVYRCCRHFRRLQRGIRGGFGTVGMVSLGHAKLFEEIVSRCAYFISPGMCDKKSNNNKN